MQKFPGGSTLFPTALPNALFLVNGKKHCRAMLIWTVKICRVTETPLIISADKNQVEIVKALLENMADPNITDKNKLTALQKATLNQDKTQANANIVQELLENKTKVTCANLLKFDCD